MIFLTVVMRIAIVVAIFMGLLPLGRFPAAGGVDSDIMCLKSLKDSLQDPLGYLSSWDFTNITEGFICNFLGISCWHDLENKVLSITLSGMGLRGQFPAGLENCGSLTALDISYNQISGPIPSDIGSMLPFIISLDLSNNYFSGFIPPSIANCSFLNVLNLNNNSLRGPIPSGIGQMPRISSVNVSDNMLTGPVPNFDTASCRFVFTNNPGLCGQLLKACKSGSDHNNRPPFFRGFMTGWGVSMGSVFFICLFAIPEIDVKNPFSDGKKKKKPQMNRGNLLLKPEEINNTVRMRKMEKYVARIPFAELIDATSSFSQDNVIGIGKMGTTYKATITNGWFLAVKWILDSNQLDRQIASEILTLGRLRHSRLVPLVGFGLKKNDTILVYKYMSNGNLYHWLHPGQGEGAIMGYWPLRFKIAVGVAEGLSWLHQNCNLSVIHGVISSKCILLDKNFEPKISNFWEAKFINSKDSTSNSSFFRGGGSRESCLDKKDVYCFGIMLLELITGREPQELTSSMRSLRPTSLLAHFSSVSEWDETLIGQGFDDEILQCLQVAKTCLQSDPGQRPSMVQVYETLAAIAQIYNYTSDYEISF